jgi:hypothetical protein
MAHDGTEVCRSAERNLTANSTHSIGSRASKAQNNNYASSTNEKGTVMPTMKAGLAVIEALRAEGIEYTFGIVGTTTNSIVTEMYGRNDIKFVDSRHEEGAAFMAYGYARASGKPGVYYHLRPGCDQSRHWRRACLERTRSGAGHR